MVKKFGAYIIAVVFLNHVITNYYRGTAKFHGKKKVNIIIAVLYPNHVIMKCYYRGTTLYSVNISL